MAKAIVPDANFGGWTNQNIRNTVILCGVTLHAIVKLQPGDGVVPDPDGIPEVFNMVK